MDTYRIVLADDHALFRQGLRSILEEMGDLEIVGEAGDGLELLHLLTLELKELAPHLIILDISMPNLRGIEAIHKIKAIHPGTKILIVTMHQDKEYLYEAIAAGADGYFLKKDANTDLFAAIDKIRQGKVYVSRYFTEQAGVDWDELRQGIQKGVLTTREIEVLKFIAEGKSNQEIADLLFISFHTVHRHRANLMEKLNIRKIADLVKYALQKGYV